MTPNHAHTHSRAHTCTHTQTYFYIYIIFMLVTRGNNGKDRTRTLSMMGRMCGSRLEVSREEEEEEGVTFHILSF